MPSLAPQKINERNWYYEDKRSLCFIHEVLDKNGNYVQTDQFRVPISKLVKSIERIKNNKK